MHWLTYFIPRTVFRTGSLYNRDIRVNEEKGKYKLLVNGARESGAYIEGLWRYAIHALGITDKLGVKNILVLGIAGGTVVHLLHAMYPSARIMGVDIDEKMIEIGKKYFGLGEIKNLRCVCQDAKEFVASNTRVRFDLIVVDVFIGPDVPDLVLSPVFERNVKKLLAANGRILINYLREPGYETKALKLLNLLESLYSTVRFVDRYNNRFFLAQ